MPAKAVLASISLSDRFGSFSPTMITSEAFSIPTSKDFFLR
jgi:hypothetical protein